MKTFTNIYDNRNQRLGLDIDEEGNGRWYVAYLDTDYEQDYKDGLEQLLAVRTKAQAIDVKRMIQHGQL